MTKQSNITIKSNVTIASSKDNDLKNIHGAVLYTIKPRLFDVRIAMYDGSRFSGTRKQWHEYIDDLPCTLCGVKGGKCKC